MILLFIIGAYIPQIDRLKSMSSTRGPSSVSVLFSAILSNCQLSEALYLHAYGYPEVHSSRVSIKSPVFMQIAKGRLRGMAAYGAVLGLLHVFAQWCCSLAL